MNREGAERAKLLGMYLAARDWTAAEEVLRQVRRGGRREALADFLEELLNRSGLTPCAVAEAAGLDGDMVLKLFRGGTRVAERDVLFAVGLALGADVAETDRMLLLNGMLPLDDWDVRDHVIAAGICQGVDSETVNRWLEFAGVPLLKFERSCERPENEGETDSPGLSETAGGMPYDASGNGDYGDAPELPFYVIDEPPLV